MTLYRWRASGFQAQVRKPVAFVCCQVHSSAQLNSSLETFDVLRGEDLPLSEIQVVDGQKSRAVPPLYHTTLRRQESAFHMTALNVFVFFGRRTILPAAVALTGEGTGATTYPMSRQILFGHQPWTSQQILSPHHVLGYFEADSTHVGCSRCPVRLLYSTSLRKCRSEASTFSFPGTDNTISIL